jgi:hypothetical protein
MSNGSAQDLHRVTTVQQRDDDTLVAYVRADNFSPGQEVEVSVYLTQGDSYATYNDKKRVPFPDPGNPGQAVVLPVELPKTKLNMGQPVTVITRVSEVWPSVLQPDDEKMEEYPKNKSYSGQGLKAVWTYKDSVGKEAGDQASPSDDGGSAVTTASQQ